MNTARRILLIEDDPKDVELTLTALGDAANDVDVVRDPAAAVQALNARRSQWPALVLLDLKMAPGSGLDVLKDLDDDARKRLPIVVLSGSTLQSDIDRCYAAGAKAYVIKPMGWDRMQRTLASTVRFWLGWNRVPRSTDAPLNS